MEQDDIYLIDIGRIFAREWRWFACVLLLALAATYAFAHAARRQWEATAWIKVGQLGLAPTGQDPKIEPFQRVLERLQTISFQNDALQDAGFAPAAPEAGLYRKSLKVDPSPYAGLIKLSLRATSPQLAGRLAAATVARLQAIHRQLAAAPLQLARQRLDEIEQALQGARADRERLRKIAAGDAAGKGEPGPALASVLLTGRNEEIRGLEQARGEIVGRLVPNYTYETGLAWPVYVPDRQAFPNPVLVWAAGLLAGIGLGAFAAIARNAARRARPA